MGLFKKIAEKLASESGELKKIRIASERRRAAKSSALLPKVEDGSVEQVVAELSKRVERGSRTDDQPL